jgi:hypothetical protein
MTEMTEAHLEREVRRLAKRHGVHGMHILDSRRAIGAAGMPDWMFIGRDVLWRELKRAYEGLEGEQAAWRWRLLAAGANYGIWRPLDLETGRIDQELQAIAP